MPRSYKGSVWRAAAPGAFGERAGLPAGCRREGRSRPLDLIQGIDGRSNRHRRYRGRLHSAESGTAASKSVPAGDKTNGRRPLTGGTAAEAWAGGLWAPDFYLRGWVRLGGQDMFTHRTIQKSRV